MSLEGGEAESVAGLISLAMVVRMRGGAERLNSGSHSPRRNASDAASNTDPGGEHRPTAVSQYQSHARSAALSPRCSRRRATPTHGDKVRQKGSRCSGDLSPAL